MFKSLSEAKSFVRKNCEVVDVFRLSAETHVAIRLVHNGEVLYRRGMATCSKRDAFDPRIGRLVALGRAEVRMARRLFNDERIDTCLENILRDVFRKGVQFPPHVPVRRLEVK